MKRKFNQPQLEQSAISRERECACVVFSRWPAPRIFGSKVRAYTRLGAAASSSVVSYRPAIADGGVEERVGFPAGGVGNCARPILPPPLLSLPPRCGGIYPVGCCCCCWSGGVNTDAALWVGGDCCEKMCAAAAAAAMRAPKISLFQCTLGDLPTRSSAAGVCGNYAMRVRFW